MSNAVIIKMCYVHNQWYDISCVTLYIYIYALRVSCWDSSVGIVYRLQAEGLRNRFSISGREVNFILVQEVQKSSVSHPSPIQFLPTIFWLHLVPKLRTSGIAPVFPHTPSCFFFVSRISEHCLQVKRSIKFIMFFSTSERKKNQFQKRIYFLIKNTVSVKANSSVLKYYFSIAFNFFL